MKLHEEIINEIGTQTLARLGLNIFSLNTYGAYNESVKATNITSKGYDQHKNNKDGNIGYAFENLDVGQKNIKDTLLNTGNKTYTTDDLGGIKKVQSIINSGKKIENLNPDDRKKFDFYKNNFADEVKSMDFTDDKRKELARHGHPTTDTVTFDKDGNIVQKSQLKVIKKTNGFFRKEHLYDASGKKMKDENGKYIYKKNKDGTDVYKYMENNDTLRVPRDSYKRHKENLEKKINDPSLSKEEKERYIKANNMLDKNEVTNEKMSKNPKATAIIMQSSTASLHIAQAGFSDAIVVALSTLANGAIYEIKDAFDDKSEISFLDRLKRLLKKVIKDFNATFKRGASFGALDVGVGILSQIFKSISNKIKTIWNTLRASAKSIYNAIYSYIKGEIKSYTELLSTILKGITSAIVVVGSVALEAQLEAFLTPLVSPVVASFLAPALSIVVGSIAVVLSMKSIDVALHALFGIIAKTKESELKLEKITSICEELLPQLIEEKEELKNLINNTYKERKLSFTNSFNEFKMGISKNNVEEIVCGLIGINEMYGKKLQFINIDDFNCFMEDKNQSLKL